MAARKRKIILNDEWRERIRAGVIMDRLMKCITGDIEMTPQQIKAADIILKKIEPDLARTETKVEGEIKVEGLQILIGDNADKASS